MSKYFTDKDMGWNKLYTEFKSAKDASVFVGYQESSGNYDYSQRAKAKKEGKPPKPITMAQLAAIHEFGSPGASIPERSFMRSALTGSSGDSIVRFLEGCIKKITDGKMTQLTALNLLGEKVVALMKKKIASGLSPALKYRKGTPLWDTGQLIKNIKAKVIKGLKI